MVLYGANILQKNALFEGFFKMFGGRQGEIVKPKGIEGGNPFLNKKLFLLIGPHREGVGNRHRTARQPAQTQFLKKFLIKAPILLIRPLRYNLPLHFT
jgi:hypothetical protein